jgi:GDP-4-dehydro-6-deoxy-D-mannose reductase
MRILVTGITGFAGGHLAEALAARPGVELHGLSRGGRWPEQWRHLEEKSRLWSCDLGNPGEPTGNASLLGLLEAIRPEQIYHLAGYANAGKSLGDADAAWANNLGATRRLYDTVVRWGGRPRILFVGSGLIYGEADAPGTAHTEESCFKPASPYASSKAAADLVSFEYTRTLELDIVRARPFNHIGPRQSVQYAVAHFAQQLAAIEAGRCPPVLETGSLDPCRDLTDVRDVVQAYVKLMETGRRGAAYNVASGQAHSMRSIVDRLLRLVRVVVEARQRAGLVRATETAVVRGSAEKLRRETGWVPCFTLEQTLKDTLDYWRQAVAIEMCS